MSSIQSILDTLDALESDYGSNPFLSPAAAAESALATAKANLAEASLEPDGLSPAEIVSRRDAARRDVDIAEIVARRAAAKRDNHAGELYDRVRDLVSETVPLLLGTKDRLKAEILAAFERLCGSTVIFTANKHHLAAICGWRVQELEAKIEEVDGRRFASVSGQEKLKQIREAVALFENFKPVP